MSHPWNPDDNPMATLPQVEARPHGGGSRRRAFLFAAQRDWGLSSAALLVVIAVPFLVVGGGLTAAALGKEAYKWYVQEDGFAETLQAVAFGVGALFSILAALRFRAAGERTLGALFLVLGLGLVFVTGEEISWGQRILGWETPESLRELNRQDETNLHNIFVIEYGLRWAQIAVGLWGTVLPLLLWGRTQGWSRQLERLTPHVILIPYFFGTLIWRLYRMFLPQPEQWRFFVAEWSEVIELNLALGFMLFFYHQWRRAAAAETELAAARV
jgi:hypothetical protein